jgi:polysaccharide biosynthesis protein PslH
MAYLPNLLAARTLIRDIVPLVRAGGHHEPVVLAGDAVTESLGDEPIPSGVRLVDSPADIVDILAGSIMVVPLTIGGGSRLKILEAFAHGAPVVSTSKGAEGLAVVADAHYLPASDPAEFASGVDRLLRDESLRSHLTGAAWRLVRDEYSVRSLARRLRDFVTAVD